MKVVELKVPDYSGSSYPTVVATVTTEVAWALEQDGLLTTVYQGRELEILDTVEKAVAKVPELSKAVAQKRAAANKTEYLEFLRLRDIYGVLT